MQIGEMAERVGVNIQTIRFYERRELLRKPDRLPSGYRDYPEDALRWVRFIKSSQEVGFTLKEIKELIRLREEQRRSGAEVRAIAEAKIRSIDEKVALLKSMRAELNALLQNCRCGDGQAPCSALVALDI